MDSDIGNWPTEASSSVRHIPPVSRTNSAAKANRSGHAGLGIEGSNGLGISAGGINNSGAMSSGGPPGQSSVAYTPSPRLMRTPTSHLLEGGTPGGDDVGDGGKGSRSPGVNGSPAHSRYGSPTVTTRHGTVGITS